MQCSRGAAEANAGAAQHLERWIAANEDEGDRCSQVFLNLRSVLADRKDNVILLNSSGDRQPVAGNCYPQAKTRTVPVGNLRGSRSRASGLPSADGSLGQKGIEHGLDSPGPPGSPVGCVKSSHEVERVRAVSFEIGEKDEG